MGDIVFQKVLKAIRDFALIKNGDKILVALSGGPDSVLLLYMMIKLREIFNIEIAAYHLNHMLRGEEAERDEVFSRKLCEDWGILFYSERVNVKEIKEKKGGSLEEIAREVRYERFRFWKDKLNFDKVALGHTRTDSIETFLYNLMRGSGIRGLSGIPPRRDFFIRPLIYLEREEIQRFLRKERIPFVMDSSNLSTSFTRNRIRLELIPLMEDIRKGVRDRIFETSLILREAGEYLQNELPQVFEKVKKPVFPGEWLLDTSKLKGYHLFIQRALFHYFWELNFEETSTILKVIGKGGRVKLRNLIFDSSFGELYVSQGEREFRELVISEPGVHKIEEFNLCVSLVKEREKDEREGFFIFLSEELLPFKVRTRKEGDRVHGKKLKEYFIRRKIPHWRRDFIPVFEHNGEIFWVPGVYLKRNLRGNLKLEVKKIHEEEFWIFDK